VDNHHTTTLLTLHTSTCQTGWCFSAYPSRGAPLPLLCYTPKRGSLDGDICQRENGHFSNAQNKCTSTTVSLYGGSIRALSFRFKRFSSKAELLKVQTILLLFCKHKYHMRSRNFEVNAKLF